MAVVGAGAVAVVDDHAVAGAPWQEPLAGVPRVGVGAHRRNGSGCCGVDGGALGIRHVGARVLRAFRGHVSRGALADGGLLQDAVRAPRPVAAWARAGSSGSAAPATPSPARKDRRLSPHSRGAEPSSEVVLSALLPGLTAQRECCPVPVVVSPGTRGRHREPRATCGSRSEQSGSGNFTERPVRRSVELRRWLSRPTGLAVGGNPVRNNGTGCPRSRREVLFGPTPHREGASVFPGTDAPSPCERVTCGAGTPRRCPA